MEEYVLTLPSSKLHFFRTISDTPGAAATGSCIYIFYVLNEKTNGVGIAVSYSTPCVYYVKLTILYSSSHSNKCRRVFGFLYFFLRNQE